MATEETHLPAKLEGKELELAYQAIFGADVAPEIGDPEVVSRAIMARIQDAETFEDAFAPQTLKSWSDFLGAPVLIRDVRLNKSTVQRKKDSEAPTVYAVVEIMFLDGDRRSEIETVQCGGRNVLVQLVKMLEKGWLDKPVRLIAKDTAAGYETLWLEAA